MGTTCLWRSLRWNRAGRWCGSSARSTCIPLSPSSSTWCCPFSSHSSPEPTTPSWYASRLAVINEKRAKCNVFDDTAKTGDSRPCLAQKGERRASYCLSLLIITWWSTASTFWANIRWHRNGTVKRIRGHHDVIWYPEASRFSRMFLPETRLEHINGVQSISRFLGNRFLSDFSHERQT